MSLLRRFVEAVESIARTYKLDVTMRTDVETITANAQTEQTRIYREWQQNAAEANAQVIQNQQAHLARLEAIARAEANVCQ